MVTVHEPSDDLIHLDYERFAVKPGAGYCGLLAQALPFVRRINQGRCLTE